MNVSSIRVEELKEKVGVVEEKYSDIILKLEKDQYSSVSEINNRIGEISKMANAMNERVSQNQKILETSISRTTTEINTLRHNLKQLGQDPNFIK
jgi:predicted nucleic acid-binding OB-fold protein